ncbi:alpha/beta hydrolase [Haloarcula sp. CBA1130]|uniref:alpha/beta hydrolase n=1 Tax=unclassified Haloarcula TaxID=2624677 RepID=UPI0012460A46|nr:MULTISPECIES: alpha/beta hydrolase [unclassified Haloarcula]KAA9399969.1 alpha/beta hydrolase [Haloarcula sp. CBA1129]KAA9401664.1 alpha/beta hydrolase [Haloarcula sp. CBA1130]
MQIRVYDEGAARDCLLVLGWGNRCRHQNVQWLIDQVARSYRVHAVELPTHITDYRREWVEPVREYAADLDAFDLLGHSAGGLTAAHLDADAVGNRVYLSPWWDSDFPVPTAVLDAVASLPSSRPFIPVDTLDAEAIGDLATARQITEGPSAFSPAFLRTVLRAQRSLPPARDTATAFCSLTDAVVDPRAVGERLPADRIRLYDGGHELFSSSGRAEPIETVLAALQHGPDAL